MTIVEKLFISFDKNLIHSVEESKDYGKMTLIDSLNHNKNEYDRVKRLVNSYGLSENDINELNTGYYIRYNSSCIDLCNDLSGVNDLCIDDRLKKNMELLAWNRGHSEGYDKYYEELCVLVELFNY